MFLLSNDIVASMPENARSRINEGAVRVLLWVWFSDVRAEKFAYQYRLPPKNLWGKQSPAQMISFISPRKSYGKGWPKKSKNLPAGTGTKIQFPSDVFSSKRIMKPCSEIRQTVT